MAEKQSPKKSRMPDAAAGLPFEEALSRLEDTITELERSDLTLDASLDLFEKGISYLRTCDTHLRKAQGRVTELLKGENGAFVERVLGDTLESFASGGGQDE
jgi:exodeoxyribonuclease VII small subunit